MNSTFHKGIVIVLSIFSCQLFAATNTTPPGHFYVGGMLGVASLADKENTNTPLFDQHTLGASGVTGGALVGYNYHLCNPWWLGLEAFLNVVNINVADNQNYAPPASYTVNMRYSAGIRILPAYTFTPTTSGHLILGYANGGFKINDNGNYGIVHQTFSTGGWQAGVGMQTALSQHVDLRADVIYTDYGSQTSNGVTTSTPPMTQRYSNNLSTLETGLSLVYTI